MHDIKRILDKCLRSGAKMAEVYSLSKNAMYIRARDGKVDTIKKSTPGGVAVRYYSFDRLAFGHTTEISDKTIDKMISRLSKLSRKTGGEEFVNLPEPQAIPDNLDLYAPSYSELSTESKIDFLLGLEDIVLKYDPLIKQSNGTWYAEIISTVKLVNSNGVELEYNDTLYMVGIDAIAAKGDEKFPAEGDFSVRHFEDLPKPDEMVDKVAGKAIRLLGGTQIDSGDYEIILTGGATRSVLYGLLFALKGDDFIKGSSFLSGKEGEKFADSRLSLYDDAVMKRGVASRPFDDEGTGSKKITLIENGVLKSALYDMRTAARASKNSTGSALREDYNSFPAIGPSNFYISAGDSKFEEVVAACKKGIVVEDTQGWGLHSVTGQYSAGINGVLVRNGKRIKPVASVTLAGSSDEVLNGIGAICDDLSFYQDLNSPTIMIKKMRIGA